MLIHLEDILPEGIEIEVCLDPDDPALRELNVQGPVKGSFKIRKMGHLILIRGAVSGRVLLECARCLKEFNGGVLEEIDIELRPALELERTAHERELGTDDLDVEFFRGDSLDIGHLVGEQVSLSVPMKPLCSDDCGGICPVCGADRTLETCGCEQDADPRWSVLRDLKDRMNPKE
jgi:uncharacterized protein